MIRSIIIGRSEKFESAAETVPFVEPCDIWIRTKSFRCEKSAFATEMHVGWNRFTVTKKPFLFTYGIRFEGWCLCNLGSDVPLAAHHVFEMFRSTSPHHIHFQDDLHFD